ncbi:MAG: ribbon-helix-helix domain-containing protein [Acidimicrobiales bacterium]
MNKTTVYLPGEIKQALSGVASTSGRSEADLIREAVTTLVYNAHCPRPRGALFAGDGPSLSEHTEEALAGFADRWHRNHMCT